MRRCAPPRKSAQAGSILQAQRTREELLKVWMEMVDQNSASWNRITGWLRVASERRLNRESVLTVPDVHPRNARRPTDYTDRGESDHR
jgi:hypothetical protein